MTRPLLEPYPKINESISMIFQPSFFKYAAPTDTIYINLTFRLVPTADSPFGQQYLNSTTKRPFDYNYIPANVTQPALRDAVIEVAVW
jgi:hypothetical protein